MIMTRRARVPDDQVTIDPEFQPSPSRIGQTRWLRLGAVAAAAFMLGGLLRSPTPGGVNTTEAAPPTTAPIRETSSTTRPSTTTTPTPVAETVGLAVPLSEVAPGFADAITMAVVGGAWGEEINVVRWLPSQAAPETIVPFREDSPDGWGWWFVGLDAAGTWYAVQDEHDVLSVRPVGAIAGDEDWWEPTREVVGLRVVDAAWHNTAPGRLAWLSCPRAPSGPATLYTLDVADASAEATPAATLPAACGEFATWINQWGDWGFALEREGDWDGETGWEEGRTWTVLLDPDGVEVAQLEQDPGAYVVAAGPAGTVWNEEPAEGAPASFLLSPDGRQRTPVPGLAAGEWVEQAQWCPDGSRIALVAYSSQVDHSLIRIVDAATGEIVTEIDELGPVVFQTRWSSDCRYLLVGHDRDDAGAAGAALVIYDTATAAIAIEEPLRELHYFTEIRTFEPSSITLQFTPVEWDIGLGNGTQGVDTLYTIVEARPLLPEHVEDVSGRLIWSETIVDLCGITIRDAGPGFVHIGDIYQTAEGCGANPNAMQETFDQFGLPELACLVITAGGVEHEYCAPLG